MTTLLTNVHPSWNAFIQEKEIINLLTQIEEQIGTNYNPTNKELIMRFLTVDLHKVKVIWLGQDVYPQEGVATGRSFEVGNLQSWQDPFKQSSLRNIIRVIGKDFYGGELLSFSKLREEMKNNHFPILEPRQWFNSLEDQGVLFLNCYLTCEIGKENSHKKIWEPFTQKLIAFINETNQEVIWFLWGKEAQSKDIGFKNKIISNHPSLLFPKKEADFSHFSGFKDTNNVINWLG